MGGFDRRGGEGGGWKEILKKPKKAKKTLAFRFRLCYYKQVAGRQRQTKENPGVAKFGIALEWGSRGLEFESQHSDHKRPEIVEISGLFATFLQMEFFIGTKGIVLRPKTNLEVALLIKHSAVPHSSQKLNGNRESSLRILTK